MDEATRKPLGGKAYGSIPHLPGSKLGEGDHHCHEGQARICTETARDKHDRVWVQEKLDGSCVAAALIDGKVLALSRAGYLATTSPYSQHWLWAWWVSVNEARFRMVLNDRERIVGEWIAQACGRVYRRVNEPFVAFDIMDGTERLPYESFTERVGDVFLTPHTTKGPLGIGEALEWVDARGRLANPGPEGCVWRVERHDPKAHARVDFLAKYVRPESATGMLLPEFSGKAAIWHWPFPSQETDR